MALLLVALLPRLGVDVRAMGSGHLRFRTITAPGSPTPCTRPWLHPVTRRLPCPLPTLQGWRASMPTATARTRTTQTSRCACKWLIAVLYCEKWTWLEGGDFQVLAWLVCWLMTRKLQALMCAWFTHGYSGHLLMCLVLCCCYPTVEHAPMSASPHRPAGQRERGRGEQQRRGRGGRRPDCGRGGEQQGDGAALACCCQPGYVHGFLWTLSLHARSPRCSTVAMLCWQMPQMAPPHCTMLPHAGRQGDQEGQDRAGGQAQEGQGRE